MSISRRLFLAVLISSASVGAYAADGDFFKELMRGIGDRSEREFFERHRDDGRWDGKYYYDRHNNKRYTRDEWRREMQWRYKEEKAGRDWRRERWGKDWDKRRSDRDDRKPPRKDSRDRDDRKGPKDRDRRDDRREPKGRDHRDDRREPKDRDRRDDKKGPKDRDREDRRRDDRH